MASCLGQSLEACELVFFGRDFDPDFRDLKESNSFIIEPDFVEFLDIGFALGFPPGLVPIVV